MLISLLVGLAIVALVYYIAVAIHLPAPLPVIAALLALLLIFAPRL